MLEKDGRKGFLLEHAGFFGNEATDRAAGAASHIIVTEADSPDPSPPKAILQLPQLHIGFLISISYIDLKNSLIAHLLSACLSLNAIHL